MPLGVLRLARRSRDAVCSSSKKRVLFRIGSSNAMHPTTTHIPFAHRRAPHSATRLCWPLRLRGSLRPLPVCWLESAQPKAVLASPAVLATIRALRATLASRVGTLARFRLLSLPASDSPAAPAPAAPVPTAADRPRFGCLLGTARGIPRGSRSAPALHAAAPCATPLCLGGRLITGAARAPLDGDGRPGWLPLPCSALDELPF